MAMTRSFLDLTAPRLVSGVAGPPELLDHKQLPDLNRWENLEPSFAGFVGDGCNMACAYWLSSILKQLKGGDLVFRTWLTASDAAEAVEFVEQQLLGVWFGEKIPYILTPGPSFLESDEQKAGVLFRF
jgi:hypothetical protein